MDLTITTESFGMSDHSWLGSAHGVDSARSVTLDIAKIDSDFVASGYAPSGLPLGVVTATGLYGQYDGDASDGRQTLVGFLVEAVKAVTGHKASGAILEHGVVKADRLPAEIDANGVADVAGRIIVHNFVGGGS